VRVRATTLESMLRVALLDRQPARLDGLRARLEADPEHDVVSLLTVPALWRRLRDFRPHAVVLAHADALALCRDLKRGPSAPAVVLVTPWIGPGFTLAAHAAGADGIVAETEPAQRMLALTRAAGAGEAALPGLRRNGYAAALDRLEDDDLPVLSMLLDRRPPATIAAALGIAPADVDVRARRIVGRLQPVA
jgi:DNA-binding NarL/FixJ family response regulator